MRIGGRCRGIECRIDGRACFLRSSVCWRVLLLIDTGANGCGEEGD
jgi:hypothetical protein